MAEEVRPAGTGTLMQKLRQVEMRGSKDYGEEL